MSRIDVLPSANLTSKFMPSRSKAGPGGLFDPIMTYLQEARGLFSQKRVTNQHINCVAKKNLTLRCGAGHEYYEYPKLKKKQKE
ncbi:hypothetical protein VCV18_004312 [Metarhizium anisopliae]